MKVILGFLLCSFFTPSFADEAGIQKIIADETVVSKNELPMLADPTQLEKPLESGKEISEEIQKGINSAASDKTMADENKVAVEGIKKEANKITEEIKNEALDSAIAGSDTLVVINTDQGPIKIKLFTKEAPKTTANFVDLVKKGFYNGTVFHRVVKGFVIQGGDPLGNGTGNYIDKETGKVRYIDLEISPTLKWDKVGRVGMARSSDPNSASCQFFIALDAVPFLDPGGVDPYGYAVFGQVTEDSIAIIKKIESNNKPSSSSSETPSNPVKMSTATITQ